MNNKAKNNNYAKNQNKKNSLKKNCQKNCIWKTFEEKNYFATSGS